MNAWLWWWQQYAHGAIDAYAARIGCHSYLVFTVYVLELATIGLQGRCSTG